MSSSIPSAATTSSKNSTGKLLAAGAGLAVAAAGIGALAYKVYKSRNAELTMDNFPIIDLANYINKTGEGWEKDCKLIANLLSEYGILIVKDPRVAESDNNTFVDMIEQYYEQPESVRAADVRKEMYYQVGVSPPGIERARNHCERISKLADSEKPLTACPPELDPKSRFFWRMGERPPTTKFAQLNADPVIPAAFPQWPNVMNKWGSHMLTAINTVCEMAALGFGLSANTFTDMMKYAPHLLGPTASNLGTDGQLGKVFASYHYDLSFITIHGRSRFPGLYIWTRSGKKLAVKVPPGCLLLQSGKQFEWLTGGQVLAGFHEVVVSKATLQAVEKAKQEKRSLWRISSTLFGHIASDATLEVLPPFRSDESVSKYPSMTAGDYVQEELKLIKLAGLAGMV
jgi:isopenicillin N synthase-like dioxygenase